MEAYHNSRESKFRKPFGALELGKEVTLCVDTWSGTLTEAVLRVWVDGEGEIRLPMTISERPGGHHAKVVFKPVHTGLCWYRFDLTDEDGNTIFVGPTSGKTGGHSGTYTESLQCPSFQITVYVERKVPDWYKKGIVYQIFPDRFARAEGALETELQQRLKEHKNGPDRKIVAWDKPVKYDKKKDGSIKTWDFYGGSLKGIQEKLPYLQNLGVSVLYLNPIFEAASNHRYDTADYKMIDPLLGTEEDFAALCKEAEKHGISIILDGVFNHTGCDSLYFNKYGNYPGVGAFQSEDSPYRDWYSFNPDVADGYDSWWGVGDLPNIREQNKDYQNFIFGDKDSVVRHWMKLGAKGWRLDVADEMPDFFIEGIKRAMLEENPENALLMGEVWEDASNKESYGEKRQYFQGKELDCVMNYPFRDGICRFLTGECTAEEFSNTLYTLLENYPSEAFYSNLNLIGSHDRMRIMNILGGAPAQDKMTEEEKAAFKMDSKQRGLAKSRLWLAALIQMTMPGVPCIYYGDEVGMEGYADPYNRGAYPWGKEDADCRTIYQNAIGVRRSHKIFTEGDFRPFHVGEEVIGYTRKLGNEAVTVLINRSQKTAVTCNIKNYGEYAADLISSKNYSSEDLEVEVKMNPMSSAVIYFAPDQRLGMKFAPGTGVLCHITSIPNNGKPGVIGPNTFKFLDLLKQKGEKYWQILPINPTDSAGSPYAGSSAFAGNLDLLPYTKEELEKQYKDIHARHEDEDIIQPATKIKAPIDKYEKFLVENAAWIDAYAMYMALKDIHNQAGWKDWDEKYLSYSEKLWKTKKLAKAADFYRYCQFVFEIAWTEVRNYAKSLDISIIGDIPLYVSADSADAWQHPEQFTIATKDMPEEDFGAGVPPDYFSADGQHWGNPLYRWEMMKQDGYQWWMHRFRRAFSLYDIVRLDHFRGFEAYWAIPGGKKPIDGSWRLGPGRDLFEKAFEQFGPLPVIAEDLGFITPGVRSLIITTGFPGMDIMQFANGDPYVSYDPDEDRISYTGTHDNETLLGWVMNRYKSLAEQKIADANKQAKDYNKANDESVLSEEAAYKGIYDKLLTSFYRTKSFIRIVPLQDLLGLDNSARMNMPGTVGKNWGWQAEEPIGWKGMK